jgi:hypothetical protein
MALKRSLHTREATGHQDVQSPGGRVYRRISESTRKPRALSGHWWVRRSMAGFLCQIPKKYSEEAQPILLKSPASRVNKIGPRKRIATTHPPPPYLEARSIRRKEYGRRRFSGARLIPQKATKMTYNPANVMNFMARSETEPLETALVRKVVQISTMVHAAKDWAFIALCDDGSLWLYRGSWSRIEDIPQTTYW